jgi:hypothetical protein
MSLQARLRKLEEAAARVLPVEAPKAGGLPADPLDEDWLAFYEHQGRAGRYDAEPDFPRALDEYREAIREAKASTDPPWDPPPDALPHLADSPRQRLREWHRQFRRVRTAWRWLGGMAERLSNDTPSVTEAEFAELARWLAENEARLNAISRESGDLLDLGDGKRDTITNIRWRMNDGPRSMRSGRATDDVRRLRARYGHGSECVAPAG